MAPIDGVEYGTLNSGPCATRVFEARERFISFLAGQFPVEWDTWGADAEAASRGVNMREYLMDFVEPVADGSPSTAAAAASPPLWR